ncbi:hypothetical protein KO507_19060 [Gilvimarinus agarilyticus]|uniref:hypothetical protein n=1 Tax=unclassified Gilvimarinus TaxID=2642066 RepID=UPI001C08552D|nr:MULTISPECIES: hypothetical protein [unclassified Gilvimarinus]MBU2887872.1 hypothetical protein [Gilvimarinus agarilyticus]MDO6572510.1 hypothetical protein [Gilvimarinus sp. 2_MG-2023]MDO6746649.1 hypothetical protein [Gilvimarinus sp. 1_MG-2023]
MATQATKKANSSESAEVAEAIDQIKQASTSVYEAFGSLSEAGKATAREALDEGKTKATDYGLRAENVLRERPVVAVGVAFAAGWLVSRLLVPRRES